MSHAIHDFRSKLLQPAVADDLKRYIEWRRKLRKAREAGEPDPLTPPLAPISINLDLTTACNYRCDHCIDWDILNSRHKHTEEDLRSSITWMAGHGLKSVILIGGGEPTLYPGFAGFVKFLKELSLQVAVVSNGGRGNRLLEAIEYLDAHDWIRLSLDSGSNELFVNMHKPVDKKINLDSICEWIPRLKERNPAVTIGFSFIIVWKGAERAGVEIYENIHEILPATERARRYGFDYISLKPFLERSPEGAEVMDPTGAREELDRVVCRIRTEVDRAKALATDRFSVYESTNLRVLEQGNWKEYTNQPRVCHMQALRQVLTPTGLYNCPAHRGEKKALVSGPQAFKDEAAARETGNGLLQLMDGFDASHECREVTCLYNGVNWWLEKMIDDPREDLDLPLAPELQDYFL